MASSRRPRLDPSPVATTRSLFIDYKKSSSPITGLEYSRLLAIATIGNLDIIQIDVAPTCLHSTLRRRFIWDGQIATLIPGRENGCGTSLRVGEDREDME